MRTRKNPDKTPLSLLHNAFTYKKTSLVNLAKHQILAWNFQHKIHIKTLTLKERSQLPHTTLVQCSYTSLKLLTNATSLCRLCHSNRLAYTGEINTPLQH